MALSDKEWQKQARLLDGSVDAGTPRRRRRLIREWHPVALVAIVVLLIVLVGSIIVKAFGSSGSQNYLPLMAVPAQVQPAAH